MQHTDFELLIDSEFLFLLIQFLSGIQLLYRLSCMHNIHFVGSYLVLNILLRINLYLISALYYSYQSSKMLIWGFNDLKWTFLSFLQMIYYFNLYRLMYLMKFNFTCKYLGNHLNILCYFLYLEYLINHIDYL